MKHKIRKIAAVLAAMVMLLSACGKTEEPVAPEVEQPLVLTAVVDRIPDTLKPAECVDAGSETILYHLYENLMRWEDDGYGYAVLVPGQAESFTVETDYLGNATYTFTLRSDIFWSDGQAVSAYHYVSAWQRIADPDVQSPYRELMRCIAGYDAVQESGDPTLLKVSATDSRTLIVTLNGCAPYFLEEVCAGVHTVPVRTFSSVGKEDEILTNGPYVLKEYSEEGIVLAKNEQYYGAGNVTVDELHFVPSEGSEADYEKLGAGTVSFVSDVPASVLETSGNWKINAVTTTCGFVFNTTAAPFDNRDVRAAFRLVIDEQAIIAALNDKTLSAAVGLVPNGVPDHSNKSVAKEEPSNSDSENGSKPPLIASNIYIDFRTHGQEIITMEISEDYTADCAYAKELFAQAGYANGAGFPQVEYLYIDTPENQTVARLLQTVWKSTLGVTVTLRAVTEEEYAQIFSAGGDGTSFQIAAMEFSAETYQDAGEFLSAWHSGSAKNYAGYSSAAFDLLIKGSYSASMPAIYDAYLHDAEAILLEDAPVVALFYRGSAFALADGLTGLYRAPNGVYFFSNVTRNKT